MTRTRPLHFEPKTPSDALALEIAEAFNDVGRLIFYRQLCSSYGRDLVYRAYREALTVPHGQIKKSRRAIFLYILHAYDKRNKTPGH